MAEAWNGVTGSVTGLFYGDAGQYGGATGWCLHLSSALFSPSASSEFGARILHRAAGFVETEIAGLDIPEMGQLGYPGVCFPRGSSDIFTHAPREFAVA